MKYQCIPHGAIPAMYLNVNSYVNAVIWKDISLGFEKEREQDKKTTLGLSYNKLIFRLLGFVRKNSSRIQNKKDKTQALQ